jgi:hypothetical protein
MPEEPSHLWIYIYIYIYMRCEVQIGESDGVKLVTKYEEEVSNNCRVKGSQRGSYRVRVSQGVSYDEAGEGCWTQ